MGIESLINSDPNGYSVYFVCKETDLSKTQFDLAIDEPLINVEEQALELLWNQYLRLKTIHSYQFFTQYAQKQVLNRRVIKFYTQDKIWHVRGIKGPFRDKVSNQDYLQVTGDMRGMVIYEKLVLDEVTRVVLK